MTTIYDKTLEPLKCYNNLKKLLFLKKLNLFSIFLIFSVFMIISFDNVVFAQTESVPEPITDLIAIPSNEEIHLSWTAPDDNGSTITSYKIIKWQTGSNVFTTFPNLSIVTDATATGLKNGVSYSFKVIAVNSIGQSTDSNIASATPLASTTTADIPSAVYDLMATRGDAKVILSWTKPNENGSPLTSNVITYWKIGTDDFKKKTLAGTATSAQITGLTNDVSYAFKINSVNAIGKSPDSNVDSATPSKSTIAKVPNQVRGLVAIPSNGQVFLSWIEPSDNGSPITSYRIIVNEKGSSVTTTYPNIGDIERTTIFGLKNEIAYQFKVAAVNGIGIGKESSSVTSTPNNRVPIVITNLKAIPGDGKVTLSWSVASTDLDSITGYRVREFKTGSDSFVTHSILGKTTTVTIDSLTNGVSYGFKVIGVNADGIGTDSNFVYVTPISSLITSSKVPSPINNLKVSSGDSQVKLTWSTPNNNGYPITGYKIIQSHLGSNSFTTIPKSDTTPEAIITGLTNNVSYQFKVVAINSEGTSKESNAVSATPKSVTHKFSLPSWIKVTAGWWSEGKISDSEYVQSIEYLINQGIIKIK